MKSVVIFPNDKKDNDNALAKRIISDLKNAGHLVYASEVYKNSLGSVDGLIYDSERKILEKSDIGIVFGGDGSILKASAACAPFGVDILGINLGQVGYMAGIEGDEADKVVSLIENGYAVESRMMLEIIIKRNNEIIFSGSPVLNDVVITKSKGYGVIEATLSSNNTLLNTYRGDGLIIASPTGSTAYSMSAGGPIVDPLLDCLCVTPICAHSLKSRPLIFKDDAILEIGCYSNNNSACVTLDGAIAFDIEDGDVIVVQKSQCRARLVKTDHMSFCSTLNKKLADK